MTGASVEIVANRRPPQQPSLLLDHEHAVAVARFLRDDPALRLDFCSNVTGVDWLDRTVKKTTKVKKLIDGEEKECRGDAGENFPGYLEAVYHLYSMAHKHGPVIVRMRTVDRAEKARACRHSRRSGAARNSRSAKSSISTASVSTAIRICAAF